MARTTADAVQGILAPSNYDGATDLEPFIETATVVVDQVVECATRKGLTLSDALLERVECYLAAHFYGHSDQFYQSRSTQGASGSFQGQTQMGFEGSQYGQTAIRLDTSGCLSAINRGARAGMKWLGTLARNVTRTGGY